MTAGASSVFKKGGRRRPGRGFSHEELKKADLSLSKALRIGLQVDLRRRTAHEENVEHLKGFLIKQKASSEAKMKLKN